MSATNRQGIKMEIHISVRRVVSGHPLSRYMVKHIYIEKEFEIP